MTTPPPVFDLVQRRKDDEHLRLLSIFHFIVGGMAFLGIFFLLAHYLVFRTIFMHPERWNSRPANYPPQEIFGILIVLYIFIGAVFLVAAALNVLSAVFLRQRRHRTFSLIVAGLNCLQIPIGTALGVFTIIVLMRDSVQQAYLAQPDNSPRQPGG